MLAKERRQRLVVAMREAGIAHLVLYGNAWQGDYLRYATDFGILEGQALAIVRGDGHVTLYVDSQLEADRAALDCPAIETVLAPDLVGEVDMALNRMRNQSVGAAPQRFGDHNSAQIRPAETAQRTEQAPDGRSGPADDNRISHT